MLIRHGAIITARSLSRGTTRAFTAQQASLLPRTRPDHGKGLTPERTEKPLEPETWTYKPVAPVVPQMPSLLEQQARLEQSIKKRVAYAKGVLATGAKVTIQESKEHHDLVSFLTFAERKKLDPNTAVYKGTHYEYTVMESLKQFGFHLHRTGKSNDKGIDLLGHWMLPGKPHEIKVLVQCKVGRGTPSVIRELEGTYTGAPSEWQGGNTLALLATSHPLTKGVLEGVQRSPSVLGALHIDPLGLARQFCWNTVAGERGLAGIGVTTKYEEVQNRGESAKEGVMQTIRTVALTWKGQPFIAKMNSK
jgi:hypothetical protein